MKNSDYLDRGGVLYWCGCKGRVSFKRYDLDLKEEVGKKGIG